MNEKHKHTTIIVIRIAFGIFLCLCVFYALKNFGGLKVLQEINDRYAAVLSALFSLALIAVTIIYVVLTRSQTKSIKETVGLNAKLLEQTEKQLLQSDVPVIVAEITKSMGTEYFGNKRRQLSIDWKLRNIGDGPAVQIYTRMKMRYSHAEFKDYDEMFEHSFISNLAQNEACAVSLKFETDKIEKMVEDFEIYYAKNSSRVKLNPSHPMFKGPRIEFRALYRNVHGQYYETNYIFYIFCLHVKTRKDKKERMIYWFTEKPLKDNEKFELVFMNMVFSDFIFNAVKPAEGEAFIQHCRFLFQ